VAARASGLVRRVALRGAAASVMAEAVFGRGRPRPAMGPKALRAGAFPRFEQRFDIQVSATGLDHPQSQIFRRQVRHTKFLDRDFLRARADPAFGSDNSTAMGGKPVRVARAADNAGAIIHLGQRAGPSIAQKAIRLSDRDVMLELFQTNRPMR